MTWARWATCPRGAMTSPNSLWIVDISASSSRTCCLPSAISRAQGGQNPGHRRTSPVISAYDTSTLEASLRALIPNLRRFELVPDAGHWIQQERAQLTNAALVEFARAT